MMNFIASLSRLRRGGPSGPPPLLVTLSKEEDARQVIKLANNVRTSTDPQINSSLFINPDFTKMERHEQFNLRSELKRRKAGGESNIIIRNGAIVKRSAAAVAAGGHP